MITVLRHSWPLLLGVLLLMVGNGVQGTLLGIRGAIEGFSTFEISVVMSGYFAGFLFGSQMAPAMIRRVGHVRVFAALGSLISAVLVVYPVAPDWIAWSALRMLSGFCFSGIYVCAESWLNNTASNETRGQALSAYMIVQMLGIISSQALLNAADPSGFTLFVIPSVLVSLAFMPLLLADSPAPGFESGKGMSFALLFQTSPLGVVGMMLTGGVFAAMFGMASVWGAMIQFSVAQISSFVAALYVGGLVLQYPIGWVSDRMDRRNLIFWLCITGVAVMAVPALFALPFRALLGVAFLLGGITNPVYALLIAHTNDYVSKEQMASASAGLVFFNGFGAIFGPVAAGWAMDVFGSDGFFVFIGLLYAALACYAAWRMRKRSAPEMRTALSRLSVTATTVAIGAVLKRRRRRDERT